MAKAKKVKSAPSKRIGEPTRQRAQHAAEIVTEPTECAGVMVHRVKAPLDYLHDRGSISARQFRAGDTLRSDHAFGVLGARDPDHSGCGSIGYGPTDAAIDAGRAYALAMRTLCLSVANVVDSVVCDEISVTALALRCRLNQQECMGYLKAGLDMLADHYKLS